jgi:WD40 repeat protein
MTQHDHQHRYYERMQQLLQEEVLAEGVTGVEAWSRLHVLQQALEDARRVLPLASLECLPRPVLHRLLLALDVPSLVQFCLTARRWWRHFILLDNCTEHGGNEEHLDDLEEDGSGQGGEVQAFWVAFLRRHPPVRSIRHLLGPELPSIHPPITAMHRNGGVPEHMLRAWQAEAALADNWRRLRCRFAIVHLTPSSSSPPSSTSPPSSVTMPVESNMLIGEPEAFTNNQSGRGEEARVVTCLQVLGGRVFAGCDDGTVRVHDMHTGALITVLRGHRGGVWTLKVRHNLAVTGSTDRTVGVWSVPADGSGKRLLELAGHTSTVRCLDLHANLIVSGSRDGTCRLWDWSLACSTHPSTHPHPSTHTHPPSITTSFESSNGAINNANCCVAVLTGHGESVRCVKFVQRPRLSNMNGGKRTGGEWIIASASYDGSVKLWTLQGQLLCSFDGQHRSGRVYSLASVGHRWLFSAGVDGQICQFDLATLTFVRDFANDLRHHRGGLVGMLCSSKGDDDDDDDGFGDAGDHEPGQYFIDEDEGAVFSGATDGTLCRVYPQPCVVPQPPLAAYYEGMLLTPNPATHLSSITALFANQRFVVTGTDQGVRVFESSRKGCREDNDAGGCRYVGNLLQEYYHDPSSSMMSPTNYLTNGTSNNRLVDTVWQVHGDDATLAVAFQHHQQTKLALFDFSSDPSMDIGCTHE